MAARKLVLVFIVLGLAIGSLRAAESSMLRKDKRYQLQEPDQLNIVAKSVGRPVPMPQVYATMDTQHVIDAKAFSFQYAKGSVVCNLLSNAFNRYYKIIFKPLEYEMFEGRHSLVKPIRRGGKATNKSTGASVLKRVVVNIHEPCEDYPSLESDESYTLEVAGDFASIGSRTLWGSLRALETFSQLVIEDQDGTYLVNDTYIQDFPRFNHRGFLLDSSRHFLDPNIIKVHLEAMAANKMNVFHWHIVDDQSFPYQSYTFPEMSDLGAYDPYNHVYTSSDVSDIIEFARQRGIRVIPEFDSPGHTMSWGKAIKILTECYTDGKPNGEVGPIDPSNNGSYTFWRSLLKELVSVFPDKYIHLGGDEVDFSCWQSNPQIAKFMETMGFGTDYSKLEQHYMQELLDVVNEVSPKTGYIIWQEVIDNNVKVKPDTVVEVWKDSWPQEMAMVTKLGYRALLSSCWYLNYISYGADWVNFYKCEPFNFTGTDQQKELVIGGEACMWGEYVDGTNVITRTWPRSSAVAERLWSSVNVTDLNDAASRIEEHRCRMIRRGIRAEPFQGSGWCDYEVAA